MNVYLIRMGETDFYKIGISRNIKKRLISIQNGNPLKVSVLYSIKHKDAESAERFLHIKYKKRRMSASKEWFRFRDEEIPSVKEAMAYALGVDLREIYRIADRIDWRTLKPYPEEEALLSLPLE